MELRNIQKHLQEELLGQDRLIELSLAAILAGGHLLLEGPPGVGKTSLARLLAESFGGSFRRVQMTSDLLPSDILGVLRPARDMRDFEFRKGPIFSNFLLADELNRTGPKTQSALLEAMAEGTVTVDGVAYSLPDPFFVIATQNPVESHGVYPLAESQLDRFMILVWVGLPPEKEELAIYESRSESRARSRAEFPNSMESLKEARNQIAKVHIESSVLEYAHSIIKATRSHPEIAHGVSVRGGLQYLSAARALAYLRGRDFVHPSEMRDLSVAVLAHRLSLAMGSGELEPKRRIISDIVSTLKHPR
ncbi:MAG: MoxR family ATPase [Bdellovibrionota bacterium]